MKEQTPIEQIIKKINVVATAKADVVDYVNRNKEWFLEIEQKQINAKVLEALDREFKDIQVGIYDQDGYIVHTLEGKEYYETEVKPKYVVI